MDFNPVKCEFLRITNKKNPIVYQYYISNSIIKQASHCKYLGVTIDERLTWNEHILTVANKARQVNAFLRRNFYQCSPYVKCNLYNVRSIIEYASPIWDPHSALNINRLESIQHSAARFCFTDYAHTSSVTPMVNKLNLCSLKERRFRSKSIMMYKMLNNLIDIPAHHFVPNHLFIGKWILHSTTHQN